MKVSINDLKKAINSHRGTNIISLSLDDDGLQHLIMTAGYGTVEATLDGEDEMVSHLLDVVDALSSNSVIDFPVDSNITIS